MKESIINTVNDEELSPDQFWPKMADYDTYCRKKYKRDYDKYLASLRWEDYQNQSGVSDMVDKAKQYIEQIQAVKCFTMPADLFYHIEGTIALYFAICGATNKAQIAAIIYLFCSRYYGKSLTSLAMKLVDDVMMSNQSGVFDSEDETPKFIKLLKSAKDNWKLCLHSEGISHISKLMSILLTLGLCDASQIDFSVGGVKLFAFAAFKKQCCACDLIDAVFCTICYFVEGGYECFRTGSITPLLSGDIDMAKLERQVAECERLAEFAKTGDLKKRANMDVNEFDTMLRQVIAKLESAIQIATIDYVKRLLRDKLEKLRKVQTLFFQTRVQGGLREAPYGMAIYGTSGVGKSSISNLLMVSVLSYNGYSANDDVLLTINDRDKFMSNMRSNVNGIFMDDVGNTKANFVEAAPTSKVIEIINNVRAYANMADLEMKGKVSIEPKVVNITTNVKDFCATTYSNEPASIARRTKFIATVTVKDMFATHGMLDYNKVQAYYNGNPPLIPDLWDIMLEEAFPIPNSTPGRPDDIGYKQINFAGPHGRHCFGACINIFDLIYYACKDSEKYFANQRSFVEQSNNLADKLGICPKCRFPSEMCVCDGSPPPSLAVPDEFSDYEDDEEDPNQAYMENQSGYVMYKTLEYSCRRYGTKVVNRFHTCLDYLENTSAEAMLERLEWLETSRWTAWTNYVPTQYLENEYMKNLVYFYSQETLRRNILSMYIGLSIAVIWCLLVAYFYSSYFMLVSLYPLWHLCYVKDLEKNRLYAVIKAENKNMPEIFKKYRDGYITYVCGLSLTVASIYILVKAWQFAKWSCNEAQGNLQPTSFNDVMEREKEAVIEETVAREHNWSTVQVASMPYNKVTATMTHAQMVDTIYKNLGFISYMEGDKRYACNVLFVRSNVAIIPNHFVQEDRIVEILRRSKVTVGSNFKVHISLSHSYHIPDTDLRLVYLPSGGSWKDITSYFPSNKMHNCPASLVYKKLIGDSEIIRVDDSTFCNFDQVGNAAATFYGATYDLNIKTFVGLCMATLVSNTRPCQIAGFHLGGISGTVKGVSGYITKQQLEAAYVQLEKIPGIMFGASEGTLNDSIYDVKILTEPKVHEKSPIHKLPVQANVEVFGSCPGRAKYFSCVEDSIIADTVHEVCGEPKRFGKPKFHLGKAWEVALTSSSQPSIGVEAKLLTRAVVDYKNGVLKQFKAIPELQTYVRPLTRMETICGIDGVRFIDKLARNTSIGAPLSGPKSRYITELNPDDYEDFACPAELDQQFWNEFDRCKAEFLKGNRVYFTFKACLKDEPTDVNKDKVRVFHAAPIVLQLFTRMYYLPIVRLFSIFPLTSECAVGINTVGPEFSALIEFMKKFGDDRILAGDYSKYDTRMPAQLMNAAFDILLEVARSYGYSENDLQIMKCVATEIVNPLMMYNGDLILHMGSNPSGQNLTVYINSIVNSLLMRCSFYELYPEATDFRRGVAMMTYGDDAKGSVHEKYDNFNHLSYADFLKRHDIVFTMPDKSSTPTKYMSEVDADFLKRKSVFNPSLNIWMGALDEKSIFKSLMSNLRSKDLTREELAIQNIDGAMREWFQYGEEMYNKRQEQMCQVAKVHNLCGCTMLSKPYETALAEYCERYNLTPMDSECQ